MYLLLNPFEIFVDDGKRTAQIRDVFFLENKNPRIYLIGAPQDCFGFAAAEGRAYVVFGRDGADTFPDSRWLM